MVINEIICYSQHLLIISDGKYSEEFEKLNYKFKNNGDKAGQSHKIYVNCNEELFFNSIEITNKKALKIHSNVWKILSNENGIYVNFESFDLKKFRRFIVAYILQFLDTNNFHCFHGAAIKIGDKTVILLGNSGAGKTTLCNYAKDQGNIVYTENFSLFYEQSLVPFYDHTLFSKADFDSIDNSYIFVALSQGIEKIEVRQTELNALRDLSVTDYFFNIFNNYSTKEAKKIVSQMDNFIAKLDSQVFKLTYLKDYNSVSEVFEKIVDLAQNENKI